MQHDNDINAVNASAEIRNPKKKKKGKIKYIILLILIMLIAGSSYYIYTNKLLVQTDFNHKMAQIKIDSDAKINQIVADNANQSVQLQSIIKKQNEKIDILQKSINNNQSFTNRNLTDNDLFKSAILLINDAQYNVNYEYNSLKAIALLEQALNNINLVKSSNKDEIMAEIIRDINNIKNNISPDDQNIVKNKMLNLMTLVNNLSVKDEQNTISDVSNSVKDWKDNTIKNINFFNNNIIKISKKEHKYVNERYQSILKENIKLQLLVVNILLKDQKYDLINNTLLNIKQILNKYFINEKQNIDLLQQEIDQLINIINDKTHNKFMILNSQNLIKKSLDVLTSQIETKDE